MDPNPNEKSEAPEQEKDQLKQQLLASQEEIKELKQQLETLQQGHEPKRPRTAGMFK